MTSTSVITFPSPFVVAPTGDFLGNDGNWSTFLVEVGTPPQQFSILPATVGQEVWVPSEYACSQYLSPVKNCGELRGIDNATSNGFSSAASSSFNQIGTGVFEMTTEQNLYGNQGALYGLDTVYVGLNSSSSKFSQPLSSQVVAVYPNTLYWLGQIGLGTLPGMFGPAGSTSYPSLLESMYRANLTTSLSFAYTAGRSYANPQMPGSLILGGYDASVVGGQSLSLPVSSVTYPATLQVNLTAITVTGLPNGGVGTVLSSPLAMNIDSSTSQIWLPGEICDNFVEQFGLIPVTPTLNNNESATFYTMNATTHLKWTLLKPTITFTLAAADTSDSITIRIPYSAMDLAYNLPYNYSNTSYFPIRRAANDSQWTLGRAFLQEAYVIVDWERQNLTIAQAASQISDPQIVQILPVLNGTGSTGGGEPNGNQSGGSPAPSSSSSSGGGSSAGAIAGGVVGGIAAVVAALVIWWYIRRRNKRRRAAERFIEPAKPVTPEPAAPDYYGDEGKPAPQPPEPEGLGTFYPPEKEAKQEEEKPAAGVQVNEFYEMPSPESGPAELASTPLHEALGDLSNRRYMGTPIHELRGSDGGSELEVRSLRSTDARSSRFASPDPFGHPSPERLISPLPEHGMGSSSSIQVASSPSVQVFSSAHQEVVSSSEIVSSPAEREILGGTGSEIVVASTPQLVASPLPERTATSPLAQQPAEDLIVPLANRSAEKEEGPQ